MSYWNNRIVVLGVMVIALVAIACGTDAASSSPTATVTPPPGGQGDPPSADPTTDAGQLTMARARWATLGLIDYEFRMNWVRFCITEYRAPVDLEVRDGKIVGGVYAPDSGLTSAVELSRYETVKGLFDLITDAIVQDAHSIEASYHPEYGYPESVFIDYDERIADEERGFVITSFSPN